MRQINNTTKCGFIIDIGEQEREPTKINPQQYKQFDPAHYASLPWLCFSQQPLFVYDLQFGIRPYHCAMVYVINLCV